MTVGRRNRHQMATEGALGVPWALLGLSVTASAPMLVSAIVG